MINEVAQGIIDISQNSAAEAYSVAISSLVSQVVPKMMGKTYDGLKKRYKDIKHTDNINNAYINYLSTIIETVGYVKVICNRDTPVRVDDIFVETNLFNGKKPISSDSIGELLKLNPAFVQINGTGGIGKTTILKYLFVKVLSQKRFIPIFIELRKINDYDDMIDIIDFIHESVSKKNLDISLEDFKETLITGKYVFFFDGFDEIKHSYQQQIFKQIQDFRTQYINNHFFVTSRELEIMQTGWSTSTILRVSSFTKEQSIKYIGKISNIPKEVQDRFIKEINDPVFFEKHQSFITNPLLLSIMMMTYHRFASIPAKLHLFYDSAFSTLYREHDAMKDGYNREKKLESAGVEQDDFEKIIEAFSINGYVVNKNTYENKTELKKIIESSRGFGEVINTKDFNADDFIWDVTNVLSLLVKEGEEFRYIHRSFQEYFSAKYVLRLNDEMQKQCLNSIYNIDFEKFYSDGFFPMLYDIDQPKINKNFVIPKLKDFLDNFKSEESYNKIVFYCNENAMFKKCLDYIRESVYNSIKMIEAKKTTKIKKQQLSIDFSTLIEKQSIVTILKRYYPNYKFLIDDEISKSEKTPLIDFCVSFFNKTIESYSDITINSEVKSKEIEKFILGLKNQIFYDELNLLFNNFEAELAVLNNIVDEFEEKQEKESNSFFDQLFKY